MDVAVWERDREMERGEREREREREREGEREGLKKIDDEWETKLSIGGWASLAALSDRPDYRRAASIL